MAEDEAVVLDFSVEVLTAPSVSEATFARAKQEFGERGVVELSYMIGFYGMIALVLRVAEVGTPDGSTPLKPVAQLFA